MTKKSRRGPDQRPVDVQAASPHRQAIEDTLATALELHKQGHLPQASVLYTAILKLDPRHADALHLSGLVAHQSQKYRQAVELIDLAIAASPHAPHYHFNRGVALQALGDLDGAAASYRRAVKRKPAYAQAYENLGVALQDMGDLDAARAAYEKALAIDSRSSVAHQNLGTLLIGFGRTTEARGHFDGVLARHPLHADAHGKRALTLLAEGRYAEGWSEYEWRYHDHAFILNNVPRVVPFPKWDGFPLEGAALLICAEQGIGDEIMFASCYPDAIRRAGSCVIECDPRLVELFARSFPQAAVIGTDKSRGFTWSDALPAIDWRIPAGSLPGLFRTKAEDFPQERSYLRPNTARIAEWKRRLASLPAGLNVGISWRGGREQRSANARSIPLREWHPIFAAANVNFIDVQYGNHGAEIAELHESGLGRLHSLDGLDPVNDVDGFVALLAALDLVISIDNSTVFMAGAVGARVWALLPSSAEWRWLPNRETSIWYPSVMLFRQAEPGIANWRALLPALAARLTNWAYRGAPPDHAAEVAAEWTGAHAHASGAAANHRAAPSSRAAASGRALLVNDTTNWYHWGCACTSLAIHDRVRAAFCSVESLPIDRIHSLAELPRTPDEFDDDDRYARFAAAHADIARALERATIVYINGEGSLHGLGPAATGLLYLAYTAKRRFRRPVHLINHSCYPEGTAIADGAAQRLYKKVYAELDFIGVRESHSVVLLRELGVDATPTFDCLPLFLKRYHSSATRARDSQRIVIAGSVAWKSLNVMPALVTFIEWLSSAGYSATVLVGANANLAGDDYEFVTELQRACGGSFSLLAAKSERQWLETIEDAALVVSGRFHYSIAAAFLGTPFLVMESNTPKIAGLLEMLGSAAFVSAREPQLSTVLRTRAAAAMADPRTVLPSDNVRARLIELAEANFAAPRLGL